MSVPTRICVVGASGSGKTTLAKNLAARLAIPYIDNDAIFWTPNWVRRPKVEFRATIDLATAEPSWTIDGNLGADPADQLVLARATAVVWLDFPRHVILHRLVPRTIWRVVSRQSIHSGNVETFYNSFLARDSVIAWSMFTQPRLKVRYGELFGRLRGSHFRTVRLRSPVQADRWLARVAAADLAAIECSP